MSLQAYYPAPDRTGERDAWMDDAVCATVAPDLWFPEKGEPYKKVMALCAACPVREACLEAALNDPGDVAGIRGGLAPRARQKLRVQRGIS